MTFHKGSIVCCLIRLRCEYRRPKLRSPQRRAISLNSTIAFRGLGRPARMSFDRLSDPRWRSGSRRATIEP
jgi:hypothetical protein